MDMGKTIIITEEQSLSLLYEEGQNENKISLTADQYIKLLKMVSGDGDMINKIPKFKGKEIVVNGRVDLRNTKTTSLGVVTINGSVDLDGSKFNKKTGAIVHGYLSYYDTPLRKYEKRQEFLREIAEQNSKRESGEWDADGTLDMIGLCANALFKYLIYSEYEEKTPEDSQRLQELYDEKERREEIETETEDDENLIELRAIDAEIEEIEGRIDVYDLVYDGKHYSLLTFKLIKGDDFSNERWAVGDEDDTERTAQEAAEQYIDDVGAENLSEWLITNNIDEEEFRDYFRDGEEEYVRENLEDFFDEDDFEYDTEVQDRIDEIEEMLEDSENLSQEQYDELNEELDELKNNEKTVPEDLIERKIEEMLDDKSHDMLNTIREYGMDIENFLDKEEVAKDIVKTDGYGHVINSYDGGEDTVDFQGETYYIFQIDG
jgi:hypothetical protein